MALRHIRLSTAHLAAAAALALSLSLGTWAADSGDLWAYLPASVPDGQLLYVLSKAFGLSAVVLVWIQMLAGLTIASRGTVAPRISVQWHQQLGFAVIAMLILHWTSFVGAASVRSGKFAVDYVLPTASHGFYRLIVSLGIVSLVTLVLAALAPLVRRYLPMWRVLHVLAAVAAVGGATHGWLIGSETRMGPVEMLYLTMVVSLAGALLWRLAWAWSRRSLGRATAGDNAK